MIEAGVGRKLCVNLDVLGRQNFPLTPALSPGEREKHRATRMELECVERPREAAKRKRQRAAALQDLSEISMACDTSEAAWSAAALCRFHAATGVRHYS